MWHGSNRSKVGSMVKKGRTFEKLRVIPTQMYYNVENVRTSDDAVVTVRVSPSVHKLRVCVQRPFVCCALAHILVLCTSHASSGNVALELALLRVS